MKKDIADFEGLFLNDYGRPLKLVPGEQEIFRIILNREPKRDLVMCATQYGKSLTVSLGIIVRAVLFPEKWAIVAPTQRKAGIIMNYIIQHLFDNVLLYSQLDVDTPLERLKRERSKERLTFKRGGEIFILSADVRNRQRVGEALMGFGAPNLILDESALIDNDIYATAKRMIGGHRDNFLMEIGNPFKRNHFLKTYQSDGYHKIVVGWEQGVSEGRFSREFIEEMRKEAFFSILYECKFPEAGEIDESGWTVLLTDTEIKEAMKRKVEPIGIKRLGVDVGRGGNYNVWIIRQGQFALMREKNRDPDLMGVVGRTKRIIEEEKVESEDTFIDDVGVGGGVVDRLKEQGLEINAIKEGEKAPDSEKFVNVKAEAYWELRKWVKDGGALEKSEDWYQLCDIKYKEDSSSKLKIMSKEDMRKQGIESPDVADALMLTFAKKAAIFQDAFIL